METGLSIQRHGSVKYEIYEKIKGAYRIDMGFERLEKNLIDIIKEETGKTGISKRRNPFVLSTDFAESFF